MKKISFNKAVKVPKHLEDITAFHPEDEADPQEAGLSSGDVQAIWSAIEDLYRSGMHPAITFCLRRKGKVVLNRAIGFARGGGPGDPEDAAKIPAMPDTPICLFSASKAISAMMIHLLVQQRKINLTDPVSHYIPEFGVNGKECTTILQVLSHRGGIATLPDDTDPETLFDREACLRILYAQKNTSPHGRILSYHAVTGGFILDEIVRRVTGGDIRQFLEEHLQKPLGMKYTSYGVPEEEVGNVAESYFTGYPILFPFSIYTRRALSVPWKTVIKVSNDPRFMKIIVPSANIVSTAEESSRFFQVLLNGGELDGVRVFDPLTVKRATTETGLTYFDRTLMIPMRYSAGMMLGANPVGLFGPFCRDAFGHWGFINSLCWADRARDMSVALLATGKPLIGPHLKHYGMLLTKINWHCSRLHERWRRTE